MSSLHIEAKTICWHPAGDIFKCIFLKKKHMDIDYSFPRVKLTDFAVLAQTMAWRRPGDEPLSEPMMAHLLTHAWGDLKNLFDSSMSSSNAIVQILALNAVFSLNPYKSDEVKTIISSRNPARIHENWRGKSLQWHHNGRDGVSNHQPRDCLFNRLFRRRSKKFPAQRANNAGNISIWWRHHVIFFHVFCCTWTLTIGIFPSFRKMLMMCWLTVFILKYFFALISGACWCKTDLWLDHFIVPLTCEFSVSFVLVCFFCMFANCFIVGNTCGRIKCWIDRWTQHYITTQNCRKWVHMNAKWHSM